MWRRWRDFAEGGKCQLYKGTNSTFHILEILSLLLYHCMRPQYYLYKIYYWSIFQRTIKVLTEYYRSTFRVIPKNYVSTIGVLSEEYWSTIGVLSAWYRNIMKVQSEYNWSNNIKVISEYFELFVYYQTIEVLSEYYQIISEYFWRMYW